MLSQDEMLMLPLIGNPKAHSNEPDNTQTGHIEIGKLDIVSLPRCHPLSCYVYQIYLDWFCWGHAFYRKCIGREFPAAGNRQGC